MVYAQISNGMVVNTIALDNTSLLPLFQLDPYGNPYDAILQIDQIYPQPSIGWAFDGMGFYVPSTLALIQNNTIVSVCQNSSNFIAQNATKYQAIIDITTLNPQPTIGWTYNSDTSLSAPPAYPSSEYFQKIVTNAMAFGNQIVVQGATRNIMMGITQAGKTIDVMSYTSQLVSCLVTGSLYAAITQINTMIADTSDTKANLSPFITNSALYSTLNQIQSYLGIPLTPNPGP